MSEKTIPYIDNSGNVVIPFNSDPQYHFWKGGQKLSDTLLQLKINKEEWGKHFESPYPGSAA